MLPACTDNHNMGETAARERDSEPWKIGMPTARGDTRPGSDKGSHKGSHKCEGERAVGRTVQVERSLA